MIDLKQIQSILLVFLFFFMGCKEEKAISYLPSINLQTDAPINYVQKVPCSTTLITLSDTIEKSAQIRYYQNNISKTDKPSFELEFDKKVVIGNISEEDDWILNACLPDPTFLRHKLSCDLFRRMNNENKTPRSGHLNVQINQSFYGVYLIEEEVNAGLLGLKKKDPFACLFVNPPVFKDNEYSKIGYQQKYPKTDLGDSSKEWKVVREFLQTSSATEFREQIGQIVDLENLMDWHILLLLTNNKSAWENHFYWYRKGIDRPFKVCIKDYHQAFIQHNLSLKQFGEKLLSASLLMKRLLEDQRIGYLKRLQTRWSLLRQEEIIAVKTLSRKVQALDKKLSVTIEENKSLPSGQIDFLEAYQIESSKIISFLEKRIPALDEYFAEISNN